MGKELLVPEVIIDKPAIPNDWDYEKSVKQVRGFVYKAKNLTQGMLKELWIAREILNKNFKAYQKRGDANAPPPPTWDKYCQDIGIEKSTANRWLKPKPIAHVAQSTGENEWYTPDKYIVAAKAVMGDIDIDPASSEIANQTIQAKAYYTIQDDGLTKSWAGRVWMNPPYSQPLIVEFSETFVRKYKSGEIKEACILVNNATETTWLQIMLEICNKICFIKRRIKFIDVEGNASGSPLQGQLILYFGNNDKEFDNEFSEFGIVK